MWYLIVSFPDLCNLTYFSKIKSTDLTHRGSYMSAHVLLNLLMELGKRVTMRGLPKFNKFNNIRARMLVSFCHMKPMMSLKSHFCHKNIIILSLCTQRCYARYNVSRKSVNH